uniref:Ell-associated factor Eaf n=1 Tax=Meloidogyne javanica TaxID=6303 RepID=A0A915LGX8_MELJA
MCSIPDGTYEIKIGETFLRGDKNNKSSKAEFNTLRFDFKPASITDGSEAFLAISSGENNGVQVIVPGETKKSTIFHGSKKPLKGDKECLLIFDQNTCQLRLEKLSANINVKKSRDEILFLDFEDLWICGFLLQTFVPVSLIHPLPFQLTKYAKHHSFIV